MKTFRHFRHALALLLVSVLLAGCNALPGENLQVEELLRAPRLSGDYGAVQTALNDWLGESAQLKYPMQGELLSPFSFAGPGRRRPAGCSRAVHHGPEHERVHCHSAAG